LKNEGDIEGDAGDEANDDDNDEEGDNNEDEDDGDADEDEDEDEFSNELRQLSKLVLLLFNTEYDLLLLSFSMPKRSPKSNPRPKDRFSLNVKFTICSRFP
jgi:TATA-binding protein-associated factor Taf7